VFVNGTSNLTDDLMKARLANMTANLEHNANFVKSAELFPAHSQNLGPRLQPINAQTMIILGRNDRFVPVDVGYRLNAGILNSELHVLNRCGHWAQWKHAERFNRLVMDFLQN
jgi:2-hydroxy-6-oxonona-2,4-dienedioate hydrolase